ncbi:MAG: hypothetical protein ACOYMS_01840 [Terrimicrobiaceae bacterium]
MRKLLVFLAPLLLSLANLSAGRLDVAVIQFPEEKTFEELATAFSAESLYEMTNSNRTLTQDAYLKGGYVLFAQSLAASPGSGINSATRIKDTRADIEGQLGSGHVTLTISLMEGIKAGLRSFQKKTYSGSGPLPAGGPRILSMKQIKGKAPSNVKGQTSMERYNLTIVVVAQYTP